MHDSIGGRLARAAALCVAGVIVCAARDTPQQRRADSGGHAPRASALDALPWDQRIGLERAMADSDSRYAPRAEGGAAAIESRGVSARIATTAHLTIGGHEATLRATSLGRGDARTELREVDAVIAGAEVRAERAPGVVEWWRELASGLEHGVTIAERPEGEGELGLQLDVRGLETRGAGDAIELVHDGEEIARYEHLAVLDARGEHVPARMRASAVGIAIEVDDAGAEYPIAIDPLLTAVQEATLAAADGAASDQLGWSVAISSVGDRAIVGAPFDDTAGGMDAGSARVFVRTGSTWMEEATLLAPDGAANDKFGISVSLTSSGDRAVVGVIGDDTVGGVDAGSARVFVRTGTTWSHEATLLAPDGTAADTFAFSVALASIGDRALVGVPYDDTAGGTDAGSVRVFVRSGTTWTQEATLVAPDGTAFERFGLSVALSSAGDRALAGVYLDDTVGGADAGSARVFVRSGTTWSQEAMLVAPDGAAYDLFGSSVALSATGDRALVGAHWDDTPAGADVGSARVFARVGTTWMQEATLLAPDGAPGDWFGRSVALASNGDIALVGRPTNSAGTDAGRARVFLRMGTTWTQEATLLAPDGAVGDSLGSSLALTSSGDRALVGASTDTNAGGVGAGSARVFTFRAADPNGSACRVDATCLSGFCVDGVCCSTACGRGAIDCQACSAALTGGADGSCAPLAAALASSITCRDAAGPCDAPEFCDPTSISCPSDARIASGTICRTAGGVCDGAEACDGTSAACPMDLRIPPGVLCRPAAGPCDASESCDGVSAACPPDAFLSAVTVCRAAAGPCDLDDLCTGMSAACPDVLAVGTSCRDSVGPCDSAEICTGTAVTCPADVFRPAGDVCAPSVGVCDAPDVCTGTSADCVATFLSGVVCRASAGGCDVAESCAGDSPTCPPDAVQGAGTVCRGSADPSCDPTEACDGMAAECPLDVTSCAPRPDAGPMADAGVLADAGPHDAAASDGSARADAGSGSDAGGTPPAAVGGCGCRAANRERGSYVWLLVGGLALARRRRAAK